MKILNCNTAKVHHWKIYYRIYQGKTCRAVLEFVPEVLVLNCEVLNTLHHHLQLCNIYVTYTSIYVQSRIRVIKWLQSPNCVYLWSGVKPETLCCCAMPGGGGGGGVCDGDNLHFLVCFVFTAQLYGLLQPRFVILLLHRPQGYSAEVVSSIVHIKYLDVLLLNKINLLYNSWHPYGSVF